ncbi:MAG TPA: RNA polymerase-binding ATPase, partial [Chthoniobacteraceae bacterium]|nr:RNA polymerase-binding ATPase [Chthoniobacteraceae bacterium]
FMSWDHPLVRGALDLLLGAEFGNAAFGIRKGSGAEAILLEIHAVVECVAPAPLHADRFLPATPVRVLVDHTTADRTEEEGLLSPELEKGDVFRLLDRGAVKKKLLPAMLAKAQELANERMRKIVEGAHTTMESQVQDEIERLEDLSAVNDHIRPAEIAAARQEKADLAAAISSARLRLDALRLIFCVT